MLIKGEKKISGILNIGNAIAKALITLMNFRPIIFEGNITGLNREA